MRFQLVWPLPMGFLSHSACASSPYGRLQACAFHQVRLLGCQSCSISQSQKNGTYTGENRELAVSRSTDYAFVCRCQAPPQQAGAKPLRLFCYLLLFFLHAGTRTLAF